MTGQEIYDKIIAHLASSPKARVVVHTAYRYTEYAPKHADMFSVSTKTPGVYVARGKARDFVYPQYLRFGMYE